MPYLKLGNDRVFFEIYGSELDLSGSNLVKKPTLIVLHGGTGQLDHTYEVPFWKKAAEFAQVVFLDNRGLGRSFSNAQCSLEQWAQDVYDFCKNLGIETPFVAGDSVGGHIAMQLGVLHPSFAAGIILMDTEAKCDRELIVKNFKERSEEAGVVARKCLYEPSPEAVDQYMEICLPLCTQTPIPEEVYRHCTIVNEACLAHYNHSILYNFDLHSQLNVIKSPVLYLASRMNPFHNVPSSIATMRSFAPNRVDFHIFENSGLVQIDAPEQAMAKIQVFLLTSSPANEALTNIL